MWTKLYGMKDNPCRRDCKKRCETCHLDCEEYIEFKAKMEKRNELLYYERERSRILYSSDIKKTRTRKRKQTNTR